MAIITQLKQEQLLIGLEEGATLTAENWNEVMKAIMNAVNENAKAVSTASAAPYMVSIYPSNYQMEYIWKLDNETGDYYCSFNKTVLNKVGDVAAHFYGIDETGAKVAVSCNYIQDESIITVRSRVNKPVLVIFR